MSQHYFTQNPDSKHEFKEIEAELRGRIYKFTTDTGVFSRNRVDRGSELLIKAMNIDINDKILDMGCGYGPIGIVAADLANEGEVLMVDINQRAVELARKNLKKNYISNATAIVNDGFENLTEKDYSVILMNPPFRTGKKIVYPLLEKSLEYLQQKGSLYTVCMTRQGAKTLAKKMDEIFGNVIEVDKGSGYRVFCSIKDR